MKYQKKLFMYAAIFLGISAVSQTINIDSKNVSFNIQQQTDALNNIYDVINNQKTKLNENSLKDLGLMWSFPISIKNKSNHFFIHFDHSEQDNSSPAKVTFGDPNYNFNNDVNLTIETTKPLTKKIINAAAKKVGIELDFCKKVEIQTFFFSQMNIQSEQWNSIRLRLFDLPTIGGRLIVNSNAALCNYPVDKVIDTNILFKSISFN
jgi:hypothetical protein